MAEQLATQPRRNFSVLASAGTGKTWQLVARLTRLLLNGASIDSILAITFTRKAAGEMQQRLNQRLQGLLEADDRQLDATLTEIGETPSPSVRQRARNLLEQWLRSEHTLRTTTFHSFCQELLQRFPLEAGLPPAFELAENTGLLMEESWDALFAEATRSPDQPLADALELLFESLNGLHNTRTALFRFVEHRGDWWALTRDNSSPVETATRHLQTQLQVVDPTAPAAGAFWNDLTRARLAEFAGLLDRHANATNMKYKTCIENTLNNTADIDTAAMQPYGVFFTEKGDRRKRASSKTQRKAMGEPGEDRFLELHEWFCEQYELLTEKRNRQQTLRINGAWYRAGQRMLEHFQRIKRERRLLDFSDLEWNTFRLLNHPEHAHWVQYKLDQRIDHLLIDEFQDTNPTQWQMILPLLQEMASGGERARSLFIVGDSKQSIYRFRRGNARLLHVASEWMQTNLDAQSIHLDDSRRSSPAVLDIVNKVFQHPDMEDLMPGFHRHGTHQTDSWGRVEIWPLIQAADCDPERQTEGLRNPLLQARHAGLDRRHYREGQAVAERIQELVEERVATYNDILVLMRSRTNLADYEAALRDCGIPYLSLDRGTLLQSLEIRDLEALLVVLMTPQDNLSLAQVLRSPVFSASDNDLVTLAQASGGPWFERLDALAERLEFHHPLARAHRLLTGWRKLAGHIPIHDLLERVFHESNLLRRYQAAFPATQTARVRANLTRFIELALEVDSGRYPTLPRFLDRVRQLRNLDKEGPSQATPESESGQRVRLLTIHASKGLEASVVFLVDSTNEGAGAPGCQTLVRWPAEADRPSDFMLLAKTRQRDSISQARYELDRQEEQRESVNLLYVAMTRARHMLVVSGCARSSRNRKQSLGWYGQIARALFDDELPQEIWTHTFGQATGTGSGQAPKQEAVDVDPRLRGPIPARKLWREIAPSRAQEDTGLDRGEKLGRLRGLAIHRMLQLASCSTGSSAEAEQIIQSVAAEFQRSPDDTILKSWWKEAVTVLENRDLAWLFEPAESEKAYNEVPIQYRHHDEIISGVIDRLLVSDTAIYLVDYKTHRITDKSLEKRLAEYYAPQMRLYGEGVQRLWPSLPLKSYLLLTDIAKLVEIA